MAANETTLAIVGAGASGTLLLVALSRRPEAQGLRIDVYERNMKRLAKGIAYSTQNNAHLLNVRAVQMSACEDDKDDFANWAAPRGFKPDDFVPRKIYGEYLAERLEEAKKVLNLTFIEADIETIRKISPEEYEIAYGMRKRSYMCVVQATGNVRPQRPKIVGKVPEFYDDPWNLDFEALGKLQNIALIGSGLTAVDTILSLYAKNYAGKISVYSRHALMPAAHAVPATWPSFLTEEDYKKTPYQLLHQVRQEVKKAREQNIPWQAVVDSLRGHTNPVWDAMTRLTREKFMKRFFTLWNVHRHRMAPQIAQAVKMLEKAGRVSFIKSSVDKITPGPILHGSGGEIKADAVINCLGYRYREEGKNFEPTQKIGPVRFGEEFETTAIPEIRMQAAEIATRFLKKY